MPETETETRENWMEEWRKQKDKERQERSAEILKLCPALAAAGIVSVVAEYSGSGDEGFTDDIMALGTGDKAIGTGDKVMEFPSDFDSERLGNLMVDTALPGGWENNDGESGNVSLDVAAGKLTASRTIPTGDTEDVQQTYDLRMPLAGPTSPPEPWDTPAIVWTKGLHPIGPESDPMCRLFGTVRILGVEFHVNAEQVVDRETADETIQEPVLPNPDDTYVDEIQTLVDGAGQTITIEGRQYLLVVSPYQR